MAQVRLVSRYNGSMTTAWVISAVAAYLCGSIPFGLLIGLAHGVDIRTQGSRNIGATNCGRVVGKQWGAICFALDVLKGLVPTAAAGSWFGWLGADQLGVTDAWLWLVIAVAAVVGHVLPIWLRFRGGKGVATGFGAMLGIWPYLTLPAAVALATWLILAAAFRYVSLASVVGSLLMPLYVAAAAWWFGWSLSWAWPFIVVTGAMGLLILWRHRTNLIRLMQGAEPRLGAQAADPDG